MCGIVGMISKRQGGFMNADQEMIRRLLIIDGEFRGLDSTGAFQVQTNRQAFIVKSATIPSLLFTTPQWRAFDARIYSGSRVVIGHNRKSTMGATNSKNAHPFHENNIILVHNGTLHNHGKLAKDVDVDSHAVCKAFAAGEADKVLPTIDGAFAFVWWDVQKDRLYAIRNKERPLSIVETPDNLYIASEAWMVYALLQRAGVQKDKITITDLPPGELYEFDVFGGKGEYKTTTIELAKEVQRGPFTGSRATTSMVGVVTPVGQSTGAQQAPKVGTTAPGLFTRGLMEAEFNEGSCIDCEGEPVDLGDRPRENVVALFPKYNKVFVPNMEIAVRLLSGTPAGPQGSYRMVGRVMHPGLPELDISGVITGVSPPELQDWYKFPVVGTVTHVTEHNAGPVVHLRGLQFDLTARMFGGTLGWTEWEWVADHCKCSKCSSDLNITDNSVTFVKRLALGEKARYHIECKECLDYQTRGDLDEKQQSGNSTVQDGKQEQSESSGSAVLRLPSPSSPGAQ